MSINFVDHPVCFSKPLRLITPFTWQEHIPFAMFLVDILKPARLVELGTMRGSSYCAFCQSVDQLKLDTRCYAVDTWTGDPQTGSYGPELLEEFQQYHDPLYGRFSTLIQGTFDSAVAQFEDRTIDLLHIDGYHAYEAVQHDFQTWKSKVSERGIILFHDISVKMPGYGAWQFWDELKLEYPHFEFSHCNGLGVLSLSPSRDDAAGYLFIAGAEEQSKIRTFFEYLGGNLTREILQQEQIDLVNAGSRDLNLRIKEQAEINKHLKLKIQEQSKLISKLQSRLDGIESNAAYKFIRKLRQLFIRHA